jgi:hypothetical protein
MLQTEMSEVWAPMSCLSSRIMALGFIQPITGKLPPEVTEGSYSITMQRPIKLTLIWTKESRLVILYKPHNASLKSNELRVSGNTALSLWDRSVPYEPRKTYGPLPNKTICESSEGWKTRGNLNLLKGSPWHLHEACEKLAVITWPQQLVLLGTHWYSLVHVLLPRGSLPKILVSLYPSMCKFG